MSPVTTTTMELLSYMRSIYLIVWLFSSVHHFALSQLQWSDLSVQYGDRTVLNISSGSATNGRLLGILGPSGCGKTTLLRVLSSRLQPTIGAVVYLDSERETDLQKHQVAFVHQDDSFFAMLTVEETMRLAAQLRHISDSRIAQRTSADLNVNDRVWKIMRSLSLVHVAGSLVGSKSSGGGNVADANNRRGISGGERKRLAVGSQMTGSPKLLIADEPTSGLDSFNSQRMVQLLRELAEQEQLIVICTIHQPRSSIWNMFDDVMLLTPQGQTAYHGPREDAVEYFSSLGHTCPAATNPAEYFVDLVSVDASTKSLKVESEARIASLVESYKSHSLSSILNGRSRLLSVRRSDQTGAQRGKIRMGGGIVKSLRNSVVRTLLLFQRSVRQIVRDYATNVVRIGTSGMLALVIGSVYGRQGSEIETSSVAGRVNIIAQAVINVAMLSMIKTLQLFKKERSVIDRERAQEQYTSIEYLVAKSFAELPIDAMVSACFGLVLHWRTQMQCSVGRFSRLLALLGSVSSSLGLAVGALAPSGDVALAVGPALMVVYLIMGSIGPSGINNSKLPSILKPFRSFSPMKWGCEALCGAEFKGRSFVSPCHDRQTVWSSIRSSFDFTKNVILSRAQGNHFRRGAAEGDIVLEDLGIADATYEHASSVLWRMLAAHLSCALVGLICACPDE